MLEQQQISVSCRGLQKSFGEGETRTQVLRGIDFTAKQGEITFLVGPSGCGKTTLISVIAGLLNPTEGQVELFGQNLFAMTSKQQILFRRHHLGFVFQQYNLLPALTAAENAAVPLLAAGMSRAAAVKKARGVLEALGLHGKADLSPKLLSGGQQQRVALARAMVHEPRLIICDEPTAALDQETGEAVMRLLASSAANAERAVLVVTHDNRVFHHAHCIAHMNDGRITHTERQVPQHQPN